MNRYKGNRDITRHEDAHCLNAANCTGPGCRVTTGKTARKQNHLRPRHNAHEAERAVATTSAKGKGGKR